MRKYGVDWLRVFVVFLLFPFHTARVFDKWEINYIKDDPNEFSSWFVAAVGFWFMALMFFLAGFSAFYAINKRTPREYIIERVKRLFIPLVFGLLLIVPVQGYLASLRHEGFHGNYLQFLRVYFFDFHDITGYTGGFTPAHLWFILYLFIISIVMLPLMQKLKKPNDKQQVNRFLWFFIFIPMTITEAMPGIGGKNPFYYALIFMTGFLVARSNSIIKWIRDMRFALFVSAVILISVYLMLISSFEIPAGISPVTITIALIRNSSVWFIILASLGYADAYLNKTSHLLNYLNQASYPVYLLHQSVMMITAYYIVASKMLPALKYISIMTASIFGTLIIFEILRRFSITRYIIGMKN